MTTRKTSGTKTSATSAPQGDATAEGSNAPTSRGPRATRAPSAVPTAHDTRATSDRAAPQRSGNVARAPRYPFAAFEEKWRARWDESGVYRVDLRHAKQPYYNLMMFPYPSAEGLHVGNMYAYVGSDAHGRWKAMQGYDVFEPIGFDAFGIHSENFAIKQGAHPRELTARNVERFRERQLKRIGNRFDWSHEVITSDPAYYRWTQWIFTQLFKAGLAERKRAAVNWCPRDKTVLADEQVIAGRCERCGSVVERRELEQWFLKITTYAQRLLDHLETLDWSERVVAAQRNWLGRSEGLEFSLRVAGQPDAGPDAGVTVYTTRPDTIYGVTFVVLAPQHPLAERLAGAAHRQAVADYVAAARATRPPDAGEAARDGSGVFTGAYAIHPLSGERLPIWVANYVLMDYGSGAIMGVPAHDERDAAFARAMGLPIRAVVRPTDGESSVVDASAEPFTGRGVLTESGPYTGMTSAEAQAAIGEEFERRGVGRRTVKWRLRDWLISRQRYWGPPIPIIYCPEHGAVPVPDEQLPVALPAVEEYRPTGTGDSPLASVESFVQTTCPICGKPARRETDVSDNFLDSAWYFLRYPSSDDATRAWEPELTRTWLPVDMYIGGAEHAVLHMLYARFLTMALHDLGWLPFEEPFRRYRANGTITRDGAKISKSRGNVVNPDAYVERYGADVFRAYLLFMGPYEAGGDFSDRGVGGVVRFLERVWALATRGGFAAGEPEGDARRALHTTIRQVSDDLAALKYNTAIATLMKWLNALEDAPQVTREEMSVFLRLLAPFAPFLTEELWERLGGAGTIHSGGWPSYDPEATRASEMTIVVQVNGRVRDRLTLASDAPDDEVKRRALASERARAVLAGVAPRQVIYVPGRLVNIVAG